MQNLFFEYAKPVAFTAPGSAETKVTSIALIGVTVYGFTEDGTVSAAVEQGQALVPAGFTSFRVVPFERVRRS